MTRIAMLQWLGTACGIAGALLLALNIPQSGWGFAIFLVNSVAWLAAGIAMRNTALIVQWAAFTVVNVIGVVRWLG